MSKLILANRYQIQQQLGKHAGRETHLALDLHTQQPVVVKLLKFGEIEWQQVKLFEREAKTLQNLDHPSIPRYLDYFELDLPNCQAFVLVQSYIEAASLQQQLSLGRNFTEDELIEIATSLLEILVYLHSRKPAIIHRDLKPSNILLTNRSAHSVGELYLVDFGSVQNIAATEGGTITVVGTYGYMPLEQFGGYTVAASDLYALGATIINLATGKTPAELPQRDGKILFEDVVSLSWHFNYWLNKITEPSLDQRFKSATEALKFLRQPYSFNNTYNITTKPKHSRIILNQTENTLEITIPFLDKNDRHQQSFSAMKNFVKVLQTIAIIYLGLLILQILYLTFGGATFVILCLGFVLMSIINFGNKNKYFQLTFDGKKITKHHSFNLYGQIMNQPDKIVEIQRNKELVNENNQWIVVYSNLCIYTEYQKKIVVSSEDNLSEEELEWLSNTVSNWVDLPIERLNQFISQADV